MKLAIVDDEVKTTDLFESYVRQFERENGNEIEVSVFHNPNDFLNDYSKDYDLVFLDIEMPALNGIETARELRRMDRSVVLLFITNMAQYAIAGYEVEALDFVLKPLSYAEFTLKMQKAMRYITRDQDKKLTIQTAEGQVHLYVSDIYYIEVIRHYLIYHTINGTYTARGVLKEVEEMLKEYHFSRSNHCYLVNMKYVKSVNGSVIKVGKEELQISRSKKAEFLKEFTKFMGGMSR
ncbi:LytR/AlgR family response regulator transcription factor [Konateibacter massiliensis]|uniref:LytR/AlgR family response regulator transcription factor n=1 Tax=Konateibacter massiliensis TaxID=2002841 RepID=UPI000C154712|nr:LytTR family DNA-binding domain-containing protein [Konateibacter massiliensis]